MLKLFRVHVRLLMLGGWAPPPGYSREIVLGDGGTLAVALAYRGATRRLDFGGRGFVAWAAYRRLNVAAYDLFIEAEAHAARAHAMGEATRRAAMAWEERRAASEDGEGGRRRGFSAN